MVTKSFLKSLRSDVDRLREKRKREMEAKQLRKEKFALENPTLMKLKRGFVSGAKAFGRGASITAKNLQKRADSGNRKSRKLMNPLTGEFF